MSINNNEYITANFLNNIESNITNKMSNKIIYLDATQLDENYYILNFSLTDILNALNNYKIVIIKMQVSDKKVFRQINGFESVTVENVSGFQYYFYLKGSNNFISTVASGSTILYITSPVM